MLAQQHAAELWRAVRRVVERPDNRLAVWDGEREDLALDVMGVLGASRPSRQIRVSKQMRELGDILIADRNAGEHMFGSATVTSHRPERRVALRCLPALRYEVERAEAIALGTLTS